MVVEVVEVGKVDGVIVKVEIDGRISILMTLSEVSS
jgi:hypothetical protein